MSKYIYPKYLTAQGYGKHIKKCENKRKMNNIMRKKPKIAKNRYLSDV